MNFSEQLLEYMEQLDCNINELCKETELSYSLINRYVNNIRRPKEDSKYFEKIVDGIYQISEKKSFGLEKEEIYKLLKKSLTADEFMVDFDLFIENFNSLQKGLNLTTVEISKSIGYDSSFISRMKNKERKPADIESFINKLRNYIILLCKKQQTKNIISGIINCSSDDMANDEKFKEIFTTWLCSKHIESKPDAVLNFLTQLDTFNLNDYIGTDFDKVKVPTSPFITKTSKTFFGIEGRKKAESQFLITTLISKSDEPIFFYSDLPMTQAGEDDNFKKDWVYAMTKLLKKGLHLNMVHNLNRPVNEMLLGLENWIPIYMTGSITPYYFKETSSNFFQISHCTSGSVALNGECLKHNEKKSKFYLTKKEEEVSYEKEKSKLMISKATSLMKIFKEKDKESFKEFINNEENHNIQKIEKDIFKNIDFCINEDKWIMINKKTAPEIHFVIYHEKLVNAIKTFLLL